MAGEVEGPGFAVDTEHGDVVTSLIATIEKLPGGIKVEATWIVSSCPFLSDIGQRAGGPYRKNPDAVVQPVAGIKKPAIGRNQDLGAEVAASKAGRQGGNRLP